MFKVDIRPTRVNGSYADADDRGLVRDVPRRVRVHLERILALLREEELVIGAILAKCSHKGYRTSRLRAMRDNMGFLVHETREQLAGRLKDVSSESALGEKLGVAWDV